MKELLGDVCSEGSDETDVLGNYQKCAGQIKDGYPVAHGRSPATPTEPIYLFHISVPRLLQFRHLQASGLPASDNYSYSWPFHWQHALTCPI